MQGYYPFLSALLMLTARVVFAQDDDDDDPAQKKSKGSKSKAAATPVDDEDDILTNTSNEPWLDPEDKGYMVFFLFLCLVCLLVLNQLRKRNALMSASSKKDLGEGKVHMQQKSADYITFQRTFLAAFALCATADSIQGPYLYKLYSYYGFPKSEIGFLFVASFFSSIVFGTLAAGLADRFGRKRLSLAYTVIYAISCLLKHSTNFNLLLSGSVLAGMSSSIFHVVFESWYVSQHKQENYPEDWLIETLSWMSFVKGCSSLLAVMVSTLVIHNFGFIAPFDAAAIFSLGGAILIHLKWKENIGDRSATPLAGFTRAVLVLGVNFKVWILGLIQVCFEGAVSIFIFSWTPILESTSAGEDLPHWIVYGSFLMSIMIGSILSQWFLLSPSRPSNESVASAANGVAAISMVISVLYQSHYFVISVLCIFQLCVGLLSPVIASQRAKHIPNEVRSSVMGIIRVPITLVTMLVLLNASQLGTTKLATFAAGLLGLALGGERAMLAMSGNSSSGSVDGSASESKKETV